MPNHLNRRRILQLIGLSGAGMALSGYSLHRGIRFPALGWEPGAPADLIRVEDTRIKLEHCIPTPSTDETLSLRAYAPEPSIILRSKEAARITFKINNIAADAELIQTPDKSVTEHSDGITRQIDADLKRNDTLILRWKLPLLKSYKFASIGDTGGGHELAWSIKRANALGARFLLHLGDFNYQNGDYERAIKLFKTSPIPCYVTIGNHDFHDNGNIYRQFLNEIGPLNNSFAIGPTRFANIDTAANFLPYSAGHRGHLFKQLIQSRDDYIDTVAFTHRPLHTPPEDDTHDIGSRGERDWLINALNSAKVTTLLSGHIHIYNREQVQGITNIIAGQGLGHQDLIVNQDYSKIIIGQVNHQGKVDYLAESLSMPMNLHCHPRINSVKQSLIDAPHYDVIRRIDKECSKQPL